MTWEPDNSLRLLREDFQTTMLIGDNAIGTLRVNLDHERRTTICVTIQTMNSSVDPLADVYLMTTSQYDRYTTAYDISNSYYWLKRIEMMMTQLVMFLRNGEVLLLWAGILLETPINMRM